jgi:hypothetical protein
MPTPPRCQSDLEARLIEVGKAAAAERGWPWLQPIEIRLTRPVPGAREWTLRSNATARGRNVRLVIAEPCFDVIDAGFLSR